jgi:hypothetical protein
VLRENDMRNELNENNELELNLIEKSELECAAEILDSYPSIFLNDTNEKVGIQ